MATPNINLTELEEGQGGSETTVNEALNVIDALLRNGVIDRDLTAPPGGESNGDIYIPAATATGDWAGHENEIAFFSTGYEFIVPTEGMHIWVDDENIFIRWDGSAWVSWMPSTAATSITANVTQTQGNGALTEDINHITVCANLGDTVTLPTAVIGRQVVVFNDGAFPAQVFPASGDNLGTAAVNTSRYLPVGSTLIVYAATAAQWTANFDHVAGAETGITANVTQTQGNGALTQDINEITTCANLDDTVTLPPATPGRTVVVRNDGAFAAQVFPASGDSINELSVNVVTYLAAGGTLIAFAMDATKWLVAWSGQQDTAEVGITANVTQTQGQTPLTKDINEITTCANVNDVVTLPTATPGRRCVVRNDGAQTLQIFPASGDAIDAGAGDASTTLVAASTMILTAMNSVKWLSVTG